MAELAAAAGIIGLTSFAHRIVRSLYETGSTFAAASKQTKRIARNIKNFADVLDMLNDVIEKDESLMSKKAYTHVSDIIDQSYDLFREIEQCLPSPRALREDLKLGEKLKWVFQKSTVEAHVKEIESLKTNVGALQGVLCFGSLLKAARCVLLQVISKVLTRLAREKKSQKQSRQSQLDAEKLETQCLKAENSIVDHLEARSAFLRAAQGDEPGAESSSASHAPAATTQARRDDMAVVAVRQQNALQRSVRRNDPLSRFGDSLANVHNASQRQALTLQESQGIVRSLTSEWTTVGEVAGAEEPAYEERVDTPGDRVNTTDSGGDRGQARPDSTGPVYNKVERQASLGAKHSISQEPRRMPQSTNSSSSQADARTSTPSAKSTVHERLASIGKQKKELPSFSHSRTMPLLGKGMPDRDRKSFQASQPLNKGTCLSDYESSGSGFADSGSDTNITLHEEVPTRPSMPKHTSSSSYLRSRVSGGKKRERRSATGSFPSRVRGQDGYFETDYRKEMPSFTRSQTIPTPKESSSKKDTPIPNTSSTLKHARTYDAGYETCSSSHTPPEMMGESPSRHQPQSSTRYQVVDPQESDEDRQTRIHVLDDDSDHRRRVGRYTQSPEPDRGDDRRHRESPSRHQPRSSTRYQVVDPQASDEDMPSFPRSQNMPNTQANKSRSSQQRSPYPEYLGERDRHGRKIGKSHNIW